MLTAADGRGILGAMLDPTVSSVQPISSRSTAVALLWFALGGPMVRPEVKSSLLAQLSVDAAVDPLAAVISTRVAAAPYAVVNGDTAIAAALSTALTTVSGVTLELFADAAPSSAPSLAPSLASSLASASATAANEPVIFLSPETAQSDCEVRLSSTTAPGVVISNFGRRELRVFVYLVQTRTNGATMNIVPARQIGSPIDVGQPTAYTALASIRAFLNQPTPFRGSPTAPVPLPLDGASDESFYEIVVIGPSTRPTAPAFFAQQRYAPHVATWNAAIEELFNRVYYGDLVYALLLELGGLGSVIPDPPSLALVVSSTAPAIPHTTDPTTPRVPQGTFAAVQAMKNNINGIALNTESIRVGFEQLGSVSDPASRDALSKLGLVDWTATIKNAHEFVLKLASPLDNYRPNGTLFKILDDLARVERGALWNARIAKSSVRILPVNPGVVAGEEITLSIELSPDLTSSYEFEWTNSASLATLSAVGEVNSGRTIVTRKLQVRLTTDASETTDITLGVVAYDVANNRRTRVSSDSTIVRIVPLGVITPDNTVLRVGDRQTFVVTAPITTPAGAKYLWNLIGGAGSIGTLNLQTTSVPSIVYTAVHSGSDRLEVQVADSSDRLLAKAATQVLVDPEEFVEINLSGAWDLQRTPPPGRYRYRDHRGIRSASPGGGGLDALFFGFNFSGDTPGVLITLQLPTGAPVTNGLTFTKNQEGQNFGSLQFAITMSVNQNDVANSSQRAILGTGTLQFANVRRVDNSYWSAEYTFNAFGPSGGTLTGQGKNRWP
jgi:hypothetical protein